MLAFVCFAFILAVLSRLFPSLLRAEQGLSSAEETKEARLRENSANQSKASDTTFRVSPAVKIDEKCAPVMETRCSSQRSRFHALQLGVNRARPKIIQRARKRKTGWDCFHAGMRKLFQLAVGRESLRGQTYRSNFMAFRGTSCRQTRA